MRKWIATIFLLAFIGQTFNQGWYYLSYLLQKKQYMARCENKFRPQLHCDGKCLLMKQIREQEKKEEGQLPELKWSAKTEIVSHRLAEYLVPALALHNAVFYTHPVAEGNPVDRPGFIFHPPLVRG